MPLLPCSECGRLMKGAVVLSTARPRREATAGYISVFAGKLSMPIPGAHGVVTAQTRHRALWPPGLQALPTGVG